MLRLYGKIFTTGVLTERLPAVPKQALSEAEGAELIDQHGSMLKAIIDQRFRESLAIRHVDAGSCNGCELEIHALGNPYYNLEGLGIRFVASPRHADMLLVTGPVAKNMEHALRIAWEATPEPKLVVAVGDCGCTGGIFGESYASCGKVSNVIPVDVAVPGCPPTPIAILQAILTAVTARAGGA